MKEYQYIAYYRASLRKIAAYLEMSTDSLDSLVACRCKVQNQNLHESLRDQRAAILHRLRNG